MPFIQPKTKSLLESTNLIGHTKQQIYLIYEDRESHWWSHFFKKGYKHVFALRFDGFFWIKMDFLMGWTDFGVVPYHDCATIKDITNGRNVIVQYVEAWRKPRYRVRLLFAPWTCVEAMKSLLGIRAWWVITPYQLFKYCEAQDAK